MSMFGTQPGYSTSSEAAVLTALANLAVGGAGTAIEKTGTNSFANVSIGGGGSGTQFKIYVTVGTANADYIISNYTDIGDAINAAYTGLPSTGGVIFVLAGTYSYLTPIVFGTSGKIVGLKAAVAGAVFLKWTPTSGTAVTYNFGNPTGHLVSDSSGITFMGSTTLIAAGNTNTNTSVGVFFGGNQGCPGVNFHDNNINGFGTCLEIGQNAYMINVQNNSISGGNGGQSSRGSLVHIDTANNSGERNNFIGNNFTDPGNSNANNGIYITSAGTASNFFNNNSIDNVQCFIGASDGVTSFIGNHFENAASSIYGAYIIILGFNSDRSTMINFIGNVIANDGSGSNSFNTIIKHGGQLYASGNLLANYGGGTVAAFIDHSLDNGVASDYCCQLQVQGGTLTNIIAGSGGVPYTEANGNCAVYNVGNSYTIGLRANSSNINEFFSGSNTTGSYDHAGNWVLGLTNNSSTVTIPGTALIYNTNTVLDASQFAGADIGAKVNAAYALGVSNGWKGVIITLPAGTQTFSTPIAISTDGTRASLRGTPGGGTYLTYTGSSSTQAITFNCGYQGDGAGSEHSSYEGMRDITLKGNDSTSASAKVGVYLGGTNGAAGIVLRNVNIETFGQGLVFGANTYHTLWDAGVIRNCAQLLFINAPSNSGEAFHFLNGFFVDPFDTTYVTANAVQIADSGTASCLFAGCSFDDAQVRIGQANNVTFTACHWENPGSANWGAYTYEVTDANLATNVVHTGDTFFATGTTSPTAYFSTGGNSSYVSCIIRKFTGTTMTNMGSITGSGRVTWSGLNNVSTTAITNIVSGIPYTPSGFVNSAGAFYTLDASSNYLTNASILAKGTGGIGYTTGAGGTVTQATSKATGVTLSKLSGLITLNAASLAAAGIVSFTVTNTLFAATDQAIITHDNTGTLGAYVVSQNTSAAGSFKITVTNISAGALAEAIVLRFNVIKGATS